MTHDWAHSVRSKWEPHHVSAIVEPEIVVVGHTTSTASRVLAVYPDSPGATWSTICARYVTASGTSVDTRTEPAATTSWGGTRFAVTTLDAIPPGATVHYACVAAGTEEAAANAVPASSLWKKYRTLPSDRPLRIALLSCNASRGPDRDRQFRLWDALADKIERGEVDLVIHAGDQIYADDLRAAHLDHGHATPLDRDAARQASLARGFSDRYVRQWSVPAIRRVLTSCPNVMMWDDHDIYDGWGSNDEDTTAEARAYFDVARAAFEQFQRSHGPDPLGASSFAWRLVHDGVGIVALDGRGPRDYAKGTIIGADQFRDLDAWLATIKTSALRHLFVVVGVPVVHAPIVGLLKLFEATPWREELTDDLRDSWIAPNNQEECRRMLLRLFDFAIASPTTQVTILAGDVHVGTIGNIRSELPVHVRKRGHAPEIHQVVSSGIGSFPPSGLAALAMRAAMGGDVELVGRQIIGRLAPLAGFDGGAVLLRRNFAVIRMSDRDGTSWEPNGNLWVEFTAEDGDEVRTAEQCLLRVG